MAERFKKFVVSWLVCVPMLVLGCTQGAEPSRAWKASDHSHPAASAVDPARRASATLRGADESQIAGAFWETACARCHGIDGRGQGSLTSATVDFTTPAWQAAANDDALTATIRSGRGAMPAFSSQFSDPQIQMLVGHIRRFGAETAQ